VQSPLPNNVTPSASQKSKLSHKAKRPLFFLLNFLIEVSHRGHTAHPDPSRWRRNHETVPALDSGIAQCGTPTLRPRSRVREPQRPFLERREQAVVRPIFLGSKKPAALHCGAFSCSFAFCFFSWCAKVSLEIHIAGSHTNVMRGLQYQHRLPGMFTSQPVSWMRAARPLLEKREREQALVRFVFRFERSGVSPCAT
jgi:hypothetical protein